ncbi:MAG TPA: VWA domain-containing protein [Candidatus Sumerlaeota bacterium]|nr:MAG: von Willebrand factor type A domain protein [candidate division BRC1 bacterium ADurb.BinA292]HOE97898.1 VWA domain-containing protein [Candidatus Sumerlaeota bacterium]
MHWGNPQMLWFLLAWPLLAWLGWAALRRRARLVARLGEHSLLGRLFPASVQRWRRRRLLRLLLAAILLTIAAARPQYGQIEQTLRSFGTHVIVAVDVSRSMKAADVPPNRLEAAKHSLTLLLRRLEGHRVGIIAFAGDAFLQCPMTLDREMATLVLRSLDTDSVGALGTNLEVLIETAMEAFERDGVEGSSAVVLLTDGEELEGNAIDAASRAAARAIRIYPIGIGTDAGAPILLEENRFLEDAQGAKVNTRLRMDTLQRIAELTGGEAFEAGDNPLPAVTAVARLIEDQEKSEIESRRRIIYEDRFQWFLAPALALIFWVLASRPEPTRAGRPFAAEGS